MNSDIIEVRKTYDYLRKCQTHLVQSSEIATACVCQNLFKLDYPFGATRSDKDYLVANTVHDIMSLCLGGPILENWDSGLENYEQTAKKIVNESSEIADTVIKDTLEGASRENRFVPDDFEFQVNNIYNGLIMGMSRRLMRKYERPSRVLAEVTVTNINDHHEGRIDALLEYPNGYGLLDWKSYDLGKAISGREKWQLIANTLLANFRYRDNEDDWTGYNFSCIVHNSGVYFPKTETIRDQVERIKTNRQFAHMVLCGKRVRVQRPKFCPVCDKGLEGSKECLFYQRDARLAYEGKLPAQYEKMTKQFFAKRYAILKERAETHLHKHVVSVLINKLGEEEALRRLERIGVLSRSYFYDFDLDEKVVFSKSGDSISLEPRRIVRIIGVERGKKLLCCINEQASVMEARNNKITLGFRSKIAVQRAKRQLFHLPIILLRDELNLTRSMLRPIHQFHKLAADMLIPSELLIWLVKLNPDQSRILNWRLESGGVAGVIGPAGCGKTTTGSFLAVKLICEGHAKNVLLVAFTNSAANEFARELSMVLGPEGSKFLCVRSGYAPGADPRLPIPFSNNIEFVRAKKIVICTTQSLKRLSTSIKFENMIIDEAGIERLEHLLSPFTLGINQLGIRLMKEKISYQTNNIIELASHCGIVATVVGDPKQSRPIGLAEYDLSAMEWVLKCTKYDTLFTTHRLPDRLAMLVNEFADYGGLNSAPEIASRRFVAKYAIDEKFKEILNPEEVITWVNLDGNEEMGGPSSWYNEAEARMCIRLCCELKRVAPSKSLSIVTRYTEQRRMLSKYLQHLDIEARILTTTGALGTQADIVIFSLVRNNPERLVGALGSLQDINVAISRSKEKLIIVGSFEMMLNGLTGSYGSNSKYKQNFSQKLARLVEKKYGRVVEAPKILYN